MTKAEPTLSQIHYIVLPLVRRAGQMLASRQKSLAGLADKARHEQGEQIETEIRDFLTNTLTRLFPGHTVFGSDYQPTEKGETNYQWIVNQLDGRRYYMRGLPLYTVSLALKRNNEIVLGIVFEPANDMAFHALLGAGAFADDQQIHTSDQKDTPEAAIYLESPVNDPAHDPKRRFAVWQAFVDAGCRVYDLGISTLGLCYVAAGAFDALIGGPEHATFAIENAAALFIAREAGATVTDQSGKPLVSSKQTSMIVAATTPVHRKIISLLE